MLLEIHYPSFNLNVTFHKADEQVILQLEFVEEK
jgi:hypothetical protein